MTQELQAAAVADEEHLARFILFHRWVRTSNNTVRPDAFIPHPHPDLSVTRHLNLTDDAIWFAGQNVATATQTTLNGRADLTAVTLRNNQLEPNPDPVNGNPNHVNVTGWPPDKASQKIIALELAAKCVYRPHQPA